MQGILRYRGNTQNSDGNETVNHFHHRNACAHRYTDRHGAAYRKMLEGWAQYAEAYRQRYEEPIGNDHTVGGWWADVGRTLKRMLDGEVGGFDCGSLNANIGDLLRSEGFSIEGD